MTARVLSRRPLVSVCMPARNCAPYLGEAIDSVLEERLDDVEVVVFDDASTDGTGRVAASFDSRVVRCFRQRRQVGIPANRNSCLAVARGRYIGWLDADDRLLPGGLGRLVERLDALPEVGLVHGRFHPIAHDGRRLPDWPMPFEADTVEPGDSAFRELVLENYVTAPVLVRRECHRRAGGFATDIGPSSTDWEMWLRLALQGDLAFVAQPLACYRQHGGSITAATGCDGRRLACDARAIRRVFATCRSRIAEPAALASMAGDALAAKAVLFARDAVARAEWVTAAGTLRQYLPAGEGASGAAGVLLDAVDDADEYAFHVASRDLLASLGERLAGTRLGARLKKISTIDPGWERTLEAIAGIVRAVVPADACVAVVDKWDPTVLRRAGRRGRHFPDRRALPDGYPADSDIAVAHLESMRLEGATHLVVPCAAFWWLTYYGGFARHLDRCCRLLWRDAHCAIYRLGEGAA